ncbi:MAG TPA: hypothetical protein DDW30_08310 [Clostridiales bacterium]|nr:hypothetical protein [Clostridiales bacterium]
MNTPDFSNSLRSLSLLTDEESRSISAENPRGEKGAGGQAASHLGVGRKGAPYVSLPAGKTVTLAEIDGVGVINHIWMTVMDKTDDANRFVLRDLVLRMYWNGEERPSVEAPLGDFFCLGFGESYTVNSALINVNPLRGMNCYIPMPFNGRARIEIENQQPCDIGLLFYQIDYSLCPSLPENTAYFHAQWRRQPCTELKRDYVLLDGVKGRGQYIGTFLALSTLSRYWWGEGEFKFYLDGDDAFPTICGTGFEDYFGGAWCFASNDGGEFAESTFNALYLGYPFRSDKDWGVTHPFHDRSCPPMHAFYRWHVPDPIRFREELRVTVQQIGNGHGGLFERQDDLSSVAYWYQSEPHSPFAPFPCRLARHPR